MMATETLARRVVLKAYSDNENYNADFDLALIELTPELVALLKARDERFSAALAADPSLHEMVFTSYTPVWFASSDLDSWLDEHPDTPGALTAIDELWDGNTLPCPEGFAPPSGPERDKAYSSEMDRMAVDIYGVCWSCTPKHSQVTITTATLAWKELL